jgi:pre-mRNA-processing factor 17
MSALVAGYESSDDEERRNAVPSSSTSRLPTLGDGFSAPPTADNDDDDLDDDQLEERARADAFGLAAAKAEEVKRTEAKSVVKAAPEVLKEVSQRSELD